MRLTAGLVLFTFVFMHLLNHAVVLFGLSMAESVQEWRLAVTRSIPGTLVLCAAALVHVVLGLFKTARRSTLRMPAWELLQILSGLAVPFLVAPHLTYSRVAHELFGVSTTYLYQLYLIWPAVAWSQALLLVVVWTHASIGIHFWLRLTRTYERLFPFALAVAVAIPVGALAGLVAGGRAARELIYDEESFAELREEVNWPSGEAFGELSRFSEVFQFASIAIVLTVVVVIAGRYLRHLLGPRVEVRYVGGPVVQAPIGATLLETSRRFGVPHASVCGGRARCSTCRVLVEEGFDGLPQPGPTENETLRSIGSPDRVRLACQIRPRSPVTVARLLPAGSRLRAASSPQSREEQGVERSLAVMFLDVRGFTTLSERRLPYDTVYLLNELFSSAGGAIVAHNGWIDKYLGDGLMAIFGRESGTTAGCREALAAARAIDLALDLLNDRFSGELAEPLRIGIGIHVGPVVLGRLGHPASSAVTVIGKTVNAASRLEALTKEFGCQIVVSNALAARTSLVTDGLEHRTTEVRGLSDTLDVLLIPKGRQIQLRDDTPAETAEAAG